ncbi:MAG: outer membrane protein, partial [Micropepsaceae bacterium]
MKTRAALLGATALIALSGTAANATTHNGWYISLEAGAGIIQDWQTVSAVATHSHIRDYGFETGWAVMGSVGYAFHSSNWRLELEAGYRENNFDPAFVSDNNPGAISNIVDNDLDGITEFSVMANVLYDIPLGTKWSLSLGAGAGWDRVDVTWGPGFFDAADTRDWQFAYQGIVGLNYEIASRWDLFVNYRYLNVAGPDLDRGPINNHPFTDTEDLTKHAVTIGLRFDL